MIVQAENHSSKESFPFVAVLIIAFITCNQKTKEATTSSCLFAKSILAGFTTNSFVFSICSSSMILQVIPYKQTKSVSSLNNVSCLCAQKVHHCTAPFPYSKLVEACCACVCVVGWEVYSTVLWYRFPHGHLIVVSAQIIHSVPSPKS